MTAESNLHTVEGMAKVYIGRAELLDRIRATVAAHRNQREAAEALGISQQYLCDILGGSREIGPKAAAGLGFVAETKYRKISA